MRDFQFNVQNQPIDVSKDFGKLENTYFNAERVVDFKPDNARGNIVWKRYSRKPRMAFNQIVVPFEETLPWEFPPDYGDCQQLPFDITFITDRTIRIRVSSRPELDRAEGSMMLNGTPPSAQWRSDIGEGETTYYSPYCSLTVVKDPWHIIVKDGSGRLVTSTIHQSDTKCLQNSDPTPFSFVRRAEDLSRRLAASFFLAPDEKIYGCGEAFTRLNKRGQKVVLWTTDAHGAQTPDMYKPIPFFLSSKGYGMFIHTSTPLTFDFGASYDQANVIYSGDEILDLFIFTGSPKEILGEYTSLTGRSPLPPIWSFGLWMSRITYKSEEETRDVATKLRKYIIPCDVIHLDTGWFEEDWRCNYNFSSTRFKDPVKMISDLKTQGFRISLWQLPYFTPNNQLYKEAIEEGYVVKNADGGLPTEDAIIDFSNPNAVEWYQALLARLLESGVGAIKVDFGEGAPVQGLYYSGKSGFYEHNLYPLRYNKAVADVTKTITGESIIWARSAWAGSQRYPLHWGGDAENTDCGMAATLRSGISLGLCGFSFWSHDMGGFVQKSPEQLYRRWTPFGALTSHSRCHGVPPKEPWAYGEEFTNDFRRSIELKYRLMPYIYAQAKECSEQGFPMIRALFFEFPNDPTSWYIEDQYLFGSDMLVAPLMEDSINRDVYLPPGRWVDYQTKHVYEGGKWYNITHGDIPIVLLVRDRVILPHIALVQSTADLDWSQIELVIFATGNEKVNGKLFLPGENRIEIVSAEYANGRYNLTDEPFKGKTNYSLNTVITNGQAP